MNWRHGWNRSEAMRTLRWSKVLLVLGIVLVVAIMIWGASTKAAEARHVQNLVVYDPTTKAVREVFVPGDDRLLPTLPIPKDCGSPLKPTPCLAVEVSTAAGSVPQTIIAAERPALGVRIPNARTP